MESDQKYLNQARGTCSISAALTLSFMLSLAAQPNLGANFIVIPQPKYHLGITSQASAQATTITIWRDQLADEFKPKTEFVKKLLALRKQAILNGMTLLTVDEILAEKSALRGEID